MISVLLPVAFLIGLEVVRYVVEGKDQPLDSFWDGYRLVIVVITIVSIVAFALLMFRLIDRAQLQVMRQNRELAATNAVSSAVQGEVGVDRIIDVVLESVLTTSGAAEASVTIFCADDRSPDGANVTRRLFADRGAAVVAPGNPAETAAPIIAFPLSTGTVTVGRMRLRLPVGEGANDCLASPRARCRTSVISWPARSSAPSSLTTCSAATTKVTPSTTCSFRSRTRTPLRTSSRRSSLTPVT